MSEFGNRLRAYREAAHLSLRELGNIAGCVKAHVWEMEQGRVINPGLSILVRLADHFDITLDALVGRSPRGKPYLRCPNTHCERRQECGAPAECMVKNG